MSEKAKPLLFRTRVGVAAVGARHILSTVPNGGVYLLPPFFFFTPGDVAVRVWTLFAEGSSKLTGCTEPIDFGRLLSISIPCFGKTIYQHL